MFVLQAKSWSTFGRPEKNGNLSLLVLIVHS
jgi:hypothetical protein